MRRLRLLSPVLLIVVCTLILFIPLAFAKQERKLLWRAANELSADNYAVAEKLALEVLALNQDSPAAALIAGDAATGLHDHERAIQYYERVGDDAGGLTTLAHLGLGQRYLKLANLEKSEFYLHKVLTENADHVEANKSYAYLMQVQGRAWESVKPTMRLIRQGVFGATEIHIAGSPANRFLFDERLIELARLQSPNEVRTILPKAKLALLENRTSVAQSTYEEIVATKPDILEPYVQLSRIYLDTGRYEQYKALANQLPMHAGDEAGVWMNKGLFAVSQNQPKQAARCFYEVLRLSPNRVEASYQLSQVLVEIGESELAQQLADRARELAFIELTIPEFYDDPTIERARTLYDRFIGLGRYWEAVAICQFVIRYYPNPPGWAYQELNASGGRLRSSGADLFPGHHLSELKFINKFDLPTDSEVINEDSIASENLTDIPELRLVDRASDAGLNFEYFNGSLNSRGMEHIFETTGGGVVAFDYDCDYWPDLYFTQGAAIWQGDDPVARKNQLFRNRGKNYESNSDVTGLGDTGFG